MKKICADKFRKCPKSELWDFGCLRSRSVVKSFCFQNPNTVLFGSFGFRTFGCYNKPNKNLNWFRLDNIKPVFKLNEITYMNRTRQLTEIGMLKTKQKFVQFFKWNVPFWTFTVLFLKHTTYKILYEEITWKKLFRDNVWNIRKLSKISRFLSKILINMLKMI